MIKNLRISLYVLSIVIFLFNYQICEYFYPLEDEESIRMWWHLKNHIYSIVIAISFIASSIDEKGVLRFVLDIGVGFTVSNVVDRLYFNTTQFTKADILMILLTFLFAIIDYKKDELRTNDKTDTP